MSSTKQQKKNVLIAALVAVVLFLAYVISQNVSFKTEWKFVEYNNGYKLVFYTQAFNDNTKEISIPVQYEGKDVVAIDDKAFYKNNKIEKVIIPDTVTELGSSVFKECKNLETVELSKNISVMGGECFKDCKSLTAIILPDTLTEIRGETFMGCSSLKEVILPKNITEIKGNTFENCSSLENIEIPSGVTRIAAHAFYGCSSLSYVFVPDTVIEIGSSAFRSCDNLQVIELPKGVSINERAFKESPTEVKTKVFADEMMMEIMEEAYTDFDTYVLYNIELGKNEIYCFFENTLVVTTSEKFREKHLKGDGSNRKNDILLIEEYDEFIKYLKKAKDSGVTTVVFYAYSEKASVHVGEPYFLISESGIDDFIGSLSPSEETDNSATDVEIYDEVPKAEIDTNIGSGSAFDMEDIITYELPDATTNTNSGLKAAESIGE